MPPETLALLFAAGLLAGAMNAVAGGGTFVSLPALAAAGLPPTMANASSTVALFPGALTSAWAYRKDMTPLEGVSMRAMLAVSLAGVWSAPCCCSRHRSRPSPRSSRGCC